MKEFEKIVEKLAKEDLSKNHFFNMLGNVEALSDFSIESIDDLNCLGLDISEYNDRVTLQTRNRSWREQKFCIVDIETNGSSLQSGSIIEIGAVMLLNGEIIDEFDSLVHAKNLSEVIVNLTGITEDMLVDAPHEASVLEQFRLFLNDSVFVAHNVSFDYNFLSHSYSKYGYGSLLNRKLCTINLAKKTIESPRYGLQFLRELFDITEGEAHRAFWDAKSAAQIFKISCDKLPSYVVTTEDLISFIKHNQSKKKDNLFSIMEGEK